MVTDERGGVMANKEASAKRILDAALAEFGTHGYQNASTNAVAEASGLSKGLIYKHFQTKANLYYQVYKRCVDDMLAEIETHLADSPTKDPFDRTVDIMLWKAAYAAKHPQDVALLLEAVAKPPEDVKERIFFHLKDLAKLSFRMCFEDISMEKIRPEFTKEDVIHYLELAVAGLQATYVKEGLTLDKLEGLREPSIRYLKTVIKGMETTT